MKRSNTVLHNGSIISIDMQGREIEYEAMAVSGGRIASLGSYEDVRSCIDDETAVIDLNGKTVLPGLCDSHLHVSMSTEMVFDFNIMNSDLSPVHSREHYINEYLEKIKAYADSVPDAKIIRGVGWNPALFMGSKEGNPTAKDLDRVCPDRPALIRSYDHHYIWVNSKALELAGITKDTPDPRNGVIGRFPDGSPNGIFQETTAMDLLLRNLPDSDYTVEEYKQGVLFFQKEFADKLGLSLVFDAYCNSHAMEAYKQLADEGKLTMRVRTAFYTDPSLPESQFDEILDKKDLYDGEDFAIKTVKFFIDGSGLSFYLNEPFQKEWLKMIGMPEDYRGYPQWTLEELKKYFLKLDTAGFQIHLHCMGDGAVKMACDAFEYVAETNDIKKNRHVITHLMMADDSDIKRMGEMGIIAAIQPMWAAPSGLSEASGAEMFGKTRTHSMYKFGTMRDAGCRITCGTDFPVTIPPSPFIGIQTGISREVGLTHPEYGLYKGLRLGQAREQLSLTDLIEGYGISGAYQCFAEDITGSLEVGKSADFIILDKNIKTVKTLEIEGVKVESKYFKGERI